MKRNNTGWTLVFSALLIGFSAPTIACTADANIDYRLYPEYCRLRCAPQKNPSDELKINRWKKALGNDKRGDLAFLHVHHYCSALIKQHNALLSTDARARADLYHLAKGEYRYVIDRWRQDSLLFPEALVRLGKLEESSGNSPAAAKYYSEAIKARPNYPPAYAAYSDWLVKLGKKDEAIKILQTGMRASPRSKLLLGRLSALGAKH